MSASHNSPPSPTSATRSGPSPIVSSGTSAASSPITTPNFTSSALNFVNVTEEEAMGGLTTIRTYKDHSSDSMLEQRAAHNAVERERRGKLSKRILELESLLSAANSDRRPTRNTTINSAIAHLQAARRHSALAAQELRMMQHEADDLRREANEWRAHAGVACLDEPVRSEAFKAVLRDALNFPVDAPDDGETDAEVHGSNGSVDEVQRPGSTGEYGDGRPLLRGQERDAEDVTTQTEGSFTNPILDHSQTPLAHYYPSSQTIVDSTNGPFDNIQGSAHNGSQIKRARTRPAGDSTVRISPKGAPIRVVRNRLAQRTSEVTSGGEQYASINNRSRFLIWADSVQDDISLQKQESSQGRQGQPQAQASDGGCRTHRLGDGGRGWGDDGRRLGNDRLGDVEVSEVSGVSGVSDAALLVAWFDLGEWLGYAEVHCDGRNTVKNGSRMVGSSQSAGIGGVGGAGGVPLSDSYGVGKGGLSESKGNDFIARITRKYAGQNGEGVECTGRGGSMCPTYHAESYNISGDEYDHSYNYDDDEEYNEYMNTQNRFHNEQDPREQPLFIR
ncbi:hypothetical protein B0H12DRAFT_1079886 [Mycena haematopus]|nr:hypothetical protein B0H12DRAFT_1079886 [Mycena haematopus]